MGQDGVVAAIDIGGMVWRELFCPGCATRLATEVARPDDEPFVELRLAR